MQWVLDGYLLTLGSLVLVGGALGTWWANGAFSDRDRRFRGGQRAVRIGAEPALLVAARMLQGAARRFWFLRPWHCSMRCSAAMTAAGDRSLVRAVRSVHRLGSVRRRRVG